MTYPVTLLSLGGVKGQGGFVFFRFSYLITRDGAHSTYFLISDSVIVGDVVLHDACSPWLDIRSRMFVERAAIEIEYWEPAQF